MKTNPLLATAALAALLMGCAISRTVQPIDVDRVPDLCIMENPQVMMDGFLKELRGQIEAKGIRTQVFQGGRPAHCKRHLEYTANWRWHLAMYLRFAEVRVYEGELLLGQAAYDARLGHFRVDKYGATSEKLRELLDELFVRRG